MAVYIARFDVGPETRRAKAAIFAMEKGTRKRLYVVPTALLRIARYVYIPVDGKYSGGSGRTPRRDWTRFENAWNLFVERARQHAPAGLRQAQEADHVLAFDEPTFARQLYPVLLENKGPHH